VSVERRAESGERRLESGKFRFCWVILGEAVPISVELDIFGILYLEMYPIAMDIITQFFFEKPTDPIGVEDCISYQTSYSICFKCIILH
jgi:hypothetical protein